MYSIASPVALEAPRRPLLAAPRRPSGTPWAPEPTAANKRTTPTLLRNDGHWVIWRTLSDEKIIPHIEAHHACCAHHHASMLYTQLCVHTVIPCYTHIHGPRLWRLCVVRLGHLDTNLDSSGGQSCRKRCMRPMRRIKTADCS